MMMLTVKVPRLPVGIETAHIGEVYVTVGQEVTRDQKVCCVETDKIIFDLRSPCNGVVENIYVKEGEFHEQSAVLIEIMTEDVEEVDFESTENDLHHSDEKEEVYVVDHELKDKGNICLFAPEIPVANDNVVSVFIKEGTSVFKDQVLMDIETDIAFFEIKAPHDGVVCNLFKLPNDTVNSGELMLTLLSDYDKALEYNKALLAEQQLKRSMINEIEEDSKLEACIEGQETVEKHGDVQDEESGNDSTKHVNTASPSTTHYFLLIFIIMLFLVSALAAWIFISLDYDILI
ncbi:biotin/lipoyl-containing protein [Pseudoalteromonas luteoviolacea]|nr:biotin/lipoyl-containing protein [Pseudoalteromonas luteoviolacea]MBQ4880240.1 hypothetical protein [Pseudoalteromonas luteoviolacea]MBQ4909301.1 hypothetical protein [Pseudoalteromonas luteoviolacea]